MPYVYDPNLDQDEEDQSNVTLSGAAPTSDDAGASASDGGNSSSAKSLNTGSGFQNLDKYLKTNESKQFGSQVLGNVQGKVNQAKTGIEQGAEQFKTQVNQSNAVPTSSQISQAIAKPQEASAQDFQKWMTQSYQGPKNLGDSSSAWNQTYSGVNQANDQAKLLGTESGRFTLLDQYFGRPQYSQGQKSLDNLLVQQSGLGRETRDLQNQATSLKTQASNTAKDLNNLAAQKASDVERSREAARGAIGLDASGNIIRGEGQGALGQAYQGVEDALSQANTQRKAEQDQIRALAAQGRLTPQMMQQFGIGTGGGYYDVDLGGSLGIEDPLWAEAQNPDFSYRAGDQLYNLNLGNYFKYGDALSQGQVTTPEQRAYIQALDKLAGVDDSFLEQPGGSAAPAYSFDSQRFLADQAASAKGFTDQYRQIYAAHSGPGQQAQRDQAIAALKAQYGIGRRIGQA